MQNGQYPKGKLGKYEQDALAAVYAAGPGGWAPVGRLCGWLRYASLWRAARSLHRRGLVRPVRKAGQVVAWRRPPAIHAVTRLEPLALRMLAQVAAAGRRGYLPPPGGLAPGLLRALGQLAQAGLTVPLANGGVRVAGKAK